MTACLVPLVLESVGARIRKDGDGLAIDAPTGVITPEIHAAVSHCKVELLAMLGDGTDSVRDRA